MMSGGSVDYNNHPAVINLKNYLKIKCVHPDIKYGKCVEFLVGMAAEIGLAAETHTLPGDLPLLVMTWEGLKPELPTILLNSHMDVVPAEGDWKHPPFGAEVEDGVIYGRGAQDMKGTSIQYLEAVRKLKSQGTRLNRTVHLTFVPEEEKGGRAGMGEFVKTEAYRRLNVGFALDEGLSNPGEEFLVFNKEKSMWHVNIICTGKSGHGSMLLPENCGEKVRYVINKFMDLREFYRQKLVDDSNLTIGEVTTINLTKLQGGVQTNIVPEQFTATFDIRLATNMNHEMFEELINRWCREAGNGVRCEFDHKDPYVKPTVMDHTNHYWVAMKKAIEDMGITLIVGTMPATTDARFLRGGAHALNFAPARRAAPSPHQRDESLPLDVFVHGIDVYEKILLAVANLEE
ncbi:aminoacylase-1-like [Choristoneura fumiferana]|uniref:aminoacylase-1-like n=1 Tax=Choristoneura fumiferana TaxID=7141 RepID=UPI003D159930